MQVIPPNKLSVLWASVPENEYNQWVSTTAYARGQRVIFAHYIYECVLPEGQTTTGDEPFEHSDIDGAPWRTIDPTNQWACIDLYGITKTRAAEGQSELEIHVPFEGAATAVYLMALECQSYQVTLEDGNGVVVYDTGIVSILEDSASWWNYWFDPYLFKQDVGIIDIPPITGVLKIKLMQGPQPAIGRIVVGPRIVFAETEYGAQAGLIDYSNNSTDKFGKEIYVKRHNARKSSFQALMRPNEANYVQQIISRRLTGIPALYIADNNMGYEPLIVFGFLKEYDVTYINVSMVRVTLDVRGIV